MDSTRRRSSFWTIGIIVGVGLIVIGGSAGYVDVATRFKFDFLSRHFGWFILALLIGLVLSFGAVIGWAKQFSAGTRRRAAGIVFIAPWVAALAGNSVERFNVHGPSVFLFYLVMPVSWLLALVLLTMAESASKT
jgi:hypothetical protein